MKYIISNRHDYSKEWDLKLNWLMDNSQKVSIDGYCINFKVITGKSFIFFNKTETYRVWRRNKGGGYGTLYQYNSNKVFTEHSPKKETLNKLYSLECELFKGAYYLYEN